MKNYSSKKKEREKQFKIAHLEITTAYRQDFILDTDANRYIQLFISLSRETKDESILQQLYTDIGKIYAIRRDEFSAGIYFNLGKQFMDSAWAEAIGYMEDGRFLEPRKT